jgi:hypothetical protein
MLLSNDFINGVINEEEDTLFIIKLDLYSNLTLFNMKWAKYLNTPSSWGLVLNVFQLWYCCQQWSKKIIGYKIHSNNIPNYMVIFYYDGIKEK